jgi:acetyl esterase/lipase
MRKTSLCRFVMQMALWVTVGMTDLCAAEPRTELIWPEGAPGARGKSPADAPTITIHLPPPGEVNRTAVVICPGGGYGGLMMSYEGHDIARWLNAQGVVGIVLKYRVSPYRHPAPLQDGQRAIRSVRARAAELGVDPARIGMMGFSAGGHLASTVGTHFDAGDPKAKDPLERVSCRPDFLVLIYPVISMGPIGHAGSTRNLLGNSPSAELIELLSNERQVTTKTPPAFLAHAKTDQAVPSENSALFAAACKSNNVPVEYFELEHGAHGLGCGTGAEWEAWQAKCIAWLKTRGLIRQERDVGGKATGKQYRAGAELRQ